MYFCDETIRCTIRICGTFLRSKRKTYRNLRSKFMYVTCFGRSGHCPRALFRFVCICSEIWSFGSHGGYHGDDAPYRIFNYMWNGIYNSLCRSSAFIFLPVHQLLEKKLFWNYQFLYENIMLTGATSNKWLEYRLQNFYDLNHIYTLWTEYLRNQK